MPIRNAFDSMATETTLAALKAVADNLLTTAQALQTTVQALNGKTVTVDTGNVAVSNLPVVQAVSATALPLPTGAATEATLAALNSKTTTVDTSNVTLANVTAALPLPTGAATEATLAALNSKAVAMNTNNVTLANVTAALPLPTGASTEASVAAIGQLNDTLLHALDRIFNNMPRLTSGKRLPVSVVNNLENDQSSPWFGMNVASVGDPISGRQVQRMFEPWNFADMAAARLYQNIVVS